MPIYPEVDPATGELTPGTARYYVKTSTVGVANGVAALNTSGKVVDSTGAAVLDVASLTTAQTALNARIDQTPYELETVSGVYPPRPATPQHVHFMDPAVQPSFDGSLAGGGGMVPDWDIWWTGGSGVATA